MDNYDKYKSADGHEFPINNRYIFHPSHPYLPLFPVNNFAFQAYNVTDDSVSFIKGKPIDECYCTPAKALQAKEGT